MHEKHGQLQINPKAHPAEPTHVIRQHADVAAALKPTVPSLNRASLRQQLCALRSRQKSVTSISSRLPFAPTLTLGSTKIQRRHQSSTQPTMNHLMQRFAVVATVGDDPLDLRYAGSGDLSHQATRHLHLLDVCAGDVPAPQATGRIADRMQRIAPEPLAAMTCPAALGVATVRSGQQERRIHHHAFGPRPPQPATKTPQHKPQQPAEVRTACTSGQRSHRRRSHGPLPMPSQPSTRSARLQASLGHTDGPIHQCAEGPDRQNLIRSVHPRTSAPLRIRQPLAGATYFPIQYCPQPTVHGVAPFDLEDRNEHNLNGRLFLFSF